MSMQQFFTAKQTFTMIIVIILNGLLFQANAAITSVSAASGRNYQVATLQVGAVQYIDRNFTFTDIDNYEGREYIRTANNDKYSTGSAFLTFTITQPGLVCVAHDDRITQKPSWLSQFTMSDVDLETTDGNPLSVYTRHFDAGTVVLGGNLAGSSGSHISMYSVVVVEQTRPTISNIEVANGRTYRLSTVALGEEQYVDRDYVFTQIGSLGGRQFIQAYNNDKFTVSDSFLSFTLDMAAVVYVAHDDRITVKPDWLLTFTDIGVNILSSDGNYPMSVFQKVFPAGRVTLGGNAQTTPPNKFISMYTVIIGDPVVLPTFTLTYGDGFGHAVQQCADKGFIIGSTTNQGDPIGYLKIFLIRTNTLGDTVWTKKFNAYPGSYVTRDLQKTSDGGYIITGSYNSNDIVLLKVDSNGNKNWIKTFAGETSDIPFTVQQTYDNGYLIGGLRNIGTGITAMFLLRTDKHGNLIWKKAFSNSGADVFSCSQQTNDSGFVILSTSRQIQNPSYYDIYVAKIDKNGNICWTKTYGSSIYNELPGGIRMTVDEGYIISCTSWDNAFFLLKIDENGNKLWQKDLAYNYALRNSAVVQTSDGGYFTLRGPGINLFKTDQSGNTMWTKSFSGEIVSYANTIQQTTDGGYVITGSIEQAGGISKVYLIKTDTNGNVNQ